MERVKGIEPSKETSQADRKSLADATIVFQALHLLDAARVNPSRDALPLFFRQIHGRILINCAGESSFNQLFGAVFTVWILNSKSTHHAAFVRCGRLELPLYFCRHGGKPFDQRKTPLVLTLFLPMEVPFRDNSTC